MKKPARKPAARKPIPFAFNQSVTLGLSPHVHVEFIDGTHVEFRVMSLNGVWHCATIPLADAANLAEFIRSYCMQPQQPGKGRRS